jgi:hypothetical protein
MIAQTAAENQTILGGSYLPTGSGDPSRGQALSISFLKAEINTFCVFREYGDRGAIVR